MYFRVKSCVATALALLTFTTQADYPGSDPTPPLVACTGQGPGSCNLGFVGYYYDGGTTWNWVTIYDNACNPIGAAYGNVDNDDNPWGLDSQLPYVVVMYNVGWPNDDYFEFGYAAYSFQGEFACGFQDAYGDTFNLCQHAFPC